MVFLDTNVLVYAIDLRDAPRGRHAPRHERRACDRGGVWQLMGLVLARAEEADMPGFVPRSRGRCEYRSAP